MIKTILEMQIPRIPKPHTPSAYVEQTARRTFKLKSNPYTFQSDLNLYYQTEASYKRLYAEMEKPNVFLDAMANDSRYTKTIFDIRNLLPREIDGNVPLKYRLGYIADTICNHSSMEKGVGLDVFYEEATQPYIKSTEAPWDDTEVAVHPVNGKEKRLWRPHVQCTSCKQYGHEAKSCDQLAKLYWAAKYVKYNSDKTVKVAEAFRQKYQPSNKATVHALI